MIDRISAGSQPPMMPGSFHPEMGVAPEGSSRDLDPRRLFASLWRRRRLLFLVWAGFIVLVLAFTAVQPKKFTTTAKLITGSGGNTADTTGTGSGNTNLPILNALLSVTGQQSAETYAELLSQSSVSSEVIKELNLNVDVGTLLSRLTVRPVPDTSLISLSMSWSDPDTSAKIANTYANVFIEHERDLVAHQADSAVAELTKALPEAENRMRSAQAALAAYEHETGIADLQLNSANSINGMAALKAGLQKAEVDEKTSSAALAAVQEKLAGTPATINTSQTTSLSATYQSLEQQVALLKGQLAAARRQYTDDFPTVLSLKSQLAEAERQLSATPQQVNSGSADGPNPVYQALEQQAAALAGTAASASASIGKLQSEINQEQPNIERLPDESSRITDLQRQLKAATDKYQGLNDKYQNALIAKTTALSDVSITQAADPGVYTKTPNFGVNVLLGIVVGFALAVTAVFLSDFFDDRFRSDLDIKEQLGMPVLAQIPLVDALESKDAEWLRPLAVEAFYQLVASLRYSSTHPPRTITFTSADQGDGKSTIALNTAISLGQMKAKVLIVDADLRRPTMHTKLGVSNEMGLSDVLVGVATLDDAIRPTEHAGVSVLSSGRPAPNPVGLLQSESFEMLLKNTRDRFDFVIVDGPALRSIVDGIVLGVKTDGTVLIVSSTSSEGRAVRSAIERLRSVGGINLLGVVLNRARPDRNAKSNYYLGAGTTVSLAPGSPG